MPRPHPDAIAAWASLPRRPPCPPRCHTEEQCRGGGTRYLTLRWGPGLSRGPCSGAWGGQAGAPAAPSPELVLSSRHEHQPTQNLKEKTHIQPGARGPPRAGPEGKAGSSSQSQEDTRSHTSGGDRVKTLGSRPLWCCAIPQPLASILGKVESHDDLDM